MRDGIALFLAMVGLLLVRLADAIQPAPGARSITMDGLVLDSRTLIRGARSASNIANDMQR